MSTYHIAYNFNSCETLVATELDEPFTFPPRNQTHTAVGIFYPCTGTVTTGRGESLLRSHPSMHEFRLKIAPGDHITARESVGQDT